MDAAARSTIYVYAVELQDGAIKIGATEDFRQRKMTLRPKRVLMLVPGSYQEELRLHTMFAQHELGSECFKPDARMVAILERMGKS